MPNYYIVKYLLENWIMHSPSLSPLSLPLFLSLSLSPSVVSRGGDGLAPVQQQPGERGMKKEEKPRRPASQLVSHRKELERGGGGGVE